MLADPSLPGILTVSFGRQIVLAMFTIVWVVVDFREREDKAPPPVSSLPDPAKSDYAAKTTAYILAWLGESSPTLKGRVLLLQLTETASHGRLSLLDFAARVLPRRLVPQTGPRGTFFTATVSSRFDLTRCCRASRSPRSSSADSCTS